MTLKRILTLLSTGSKFWVSAVFLVLALAIMFQMAVLSRQVVGHLARLQSASSDNTQWMLAQAEVEFLEFAHAVDQATTVSEPDVVTLRREFDIFYSRIGTISSSALYSGLQSNTDFAEALATTRTFLETVTPLIDAPDAELQAGLPDLQGRVWDLRPTLRQLANSGLFYFAQQSDAGRNDIAQTLRRLAVVVLMLFAALTLLSVYLGVINRQIVRRGRELSQANRRMNTILSTSLDGVIVADTRGEVIEFNEAAESIFGRRFEDVKGQKIGDLIVPPHLRDAHDAGMKRMQAGGEKRVVGKGRVRLDAMRANGDVFPVEMALQSAQHRDTEIIIAFLRDISHRVAAEEELVLARDRAVAGEQAKADFLAVMSHEIRTPMNGVLGNLSLLQESRLSHKQAEYVRNMEISGRILMSHVDSVLDIAKFEAGKLNIANEPVALSGLLQDIVDGQSSYAEAQGTVIEWQWVGPALNWVATDPARLQQIVLNLVGNAIKFTKHGRITIEAEVLADPLPDNHSRQLVEFRVIDTGTGIPEEDLGQVFEDFETRDTSFGRTTGGTGLGLAIARRMVQALDGEIGAESEVGKGSVFWLRLPLDPCAPPDADDLQMSEATGHGPLSVLVVEDNEINLQVARDMLERDGHTVTSAMDGQSGIQVADTQHFDLILMDISMPFLDGVQATTAIRSGNGKSADTPIIALSANVLPQDIDRFRAAGMDDFLSKPLGLDDLRKAVGSLDEIRASAPEAPAASGGVDHQQLTETKDTLSPVAFNKLLDRFVAESSELVESLATLAVSPDALPGIAQKCHKVAGSAAVFGARDFRTGLIDLENRAKDGDAEAVGNAVQGLAETWSETREVLSAD